MSQAKVDKYKQEKANRKEIMAKEKRNRMIAKVCGGVICGILAVWIGVSTVDFIIENRPVDTIYCTTSAIDDYLSSLYEDEDDKKDEENKEENKTEDKKEESTEKTTEES